MKLLCNCLYNKMAKLLHGILEGMIMSTLQKSLYNKKNQLYATQIKCNINIDCKTCQISCESLKEYDLTNIIFHLT